MTVRVKNEGVIELTGRCEAGDAEILLQHLLAAPGSSVEWQACAYLHAAVAQVLLASGPRMHGTPRSAFLANHIAPILSGSATQSPAREIARSNEEP